MKVLHLINTLSAGGAELHLLTLCRWLKRRGLGVVVACLREQVKGSRRLRDDFEREGIRVVNLRGSGRYDWRFLGRLGALIRQEQPDVFHTHLPRADLAGAAQHVFHASTPWFCSVHGVYSQATWSGKWTLPLLNLVLHRVRGIIAISHAVREWLVDERGVQPEKVRVIHYGIEPETFARPRCELRDRWGLDGQAVIGSIGRLEPKKGHDALIRAMPAICRHVPQACLLIAGYDPRNYGHTLQRLIDRLRLQDHVRLVGFQDDVPSFLHALDVFAFASTTEGFGQVVIEAMAAGKPVVASKIAPLTETVVDSHTGMLVEPDDSQALADAISWLLLHPEEARRMGAYGRARVYEHFSAERMAEHTVDFYRVGLQATHPGPRVLT